MNFIRLAGLTTVGAIGVFIALLRRHDRGRELYKPAFSKTYE
jgi:hypothetical protein